MATVKMEIEDGVGDRSRKVELRARDLDTVIVNAVALAIAFTHDPDAAMERLRRELRTTPGVGSRA